MAGILLMAAGGVYVMAQTIEKADPSFVTALKTNISGIYFGQVAHYRPAEIEREFRKAVQDPALAGDEEFMTNLMFLVRMKEVRNLRDEVLRLVAAKQLKPGAQVSGLKTAFAIGGLADRDAIDKMEAEALVELAESGKSPGGSPFSEASDRIGGPRTLTALQRLQSDAMKRQTAAEHESPDDHALIGGLDKVRARLQGQVADLSRKVKVLAQPEPQRTADLARVYMARPAYLTCWAYRELIGGASPASWAIVQDVVTHEIPTFLPSSGQSPEIRSKAELDLRLRGIALLQKMGAPLPPDAAQLLKENYLKIKAREPYFYPECTWEEVLDLV
jgi:hypothetical protein